MCILLCREGKEKTKKPAPIKKLLFNGRYGKIVFRNFYEKADKAKFRMLMWVNYGQRILFFLSYRYLVFVFLQIRSLIIKMFYVLQHKNTFDKN